MEHGSHFISQLLHRTALYAIQEGMRTGFTRFTDNHELFLRHFPLDPKREALYSRALVDEEAATGSAFSRSFEQVAVAVSSAHKAGLTTDDFLKIVDKMAEFSKIVSTIPPQLRQAPDAIVVKPEDRTATASPPSSRKRMILSGFGFFERAYNLLGSSAQLTSPPEGNALLLALRQAIKNISKLIIGQ